MLHFFTNKSLFYLNQYRVFYPFHINLSNKWTGSVVLTIIKKKDLMDHIIKDQWKSVICHIIRIFGQWCGTSIMNHLKEASSRGPSIYYKPMDQRYGINSGPAFFLIMFDQGPFQVLISLDNRVQFRNPEMCEKSGSWNYARYLLQIRMIIRTTQVFIGSSDHCR